MTIIDLITFADVFDLQGAGPTLMLDFSVPAMGGTASLIRSYWLNLTVKNFEPTQIFPYGISISAISAPRIEGGE
jgi:hypothetical protein